MRSAILHVLVVGHHHVLPPVPFDRIRRHSADGNTVLHMFTSKTHKPAEAAKADQPNYAGMMRSFSSRG